MFYLHFIELFCMFVKEDGNGINFDVNDYTYSYWVYSAEKEKRFAEIYRYWIKNEMDY